MVSLKNKNKITKLHKSQIEKIKSIFTFNWIRKIKELFLIKPKSLKQVLKILKESTRNQIITQESYNMIEGVLEISTMQARDIMVPRAQMIVLEKDSDPNEFLPQMIESGHSRFPVIGENRDEILGILLAKDVLPYILKSEKINIKELLRPAMVIPESKRLNILLKEFRVKRQHMAIIADEYGGISGLVTIEDILEQIVGEIEDEFDTEEENNIIELKNKTFHVQALTPIEEFNQYFNTNFSDDEFDTIGGVILNNFGYLPKKNESINIDNFKIKVVNADKRRIRLLKVNLLNKNKNSSKPENSNNNSLEKNNSDNINTADNSNNKNQNINSNL